MRGWTLPVGGLLVLCLAWSAAAQESPPSPSASDPRESGARLLSPSRIPGLPINAAQFPGHVTVITADEIRAAGAASVPELLGRLPGVHVMDTNGFGLGADSSVNLRGVVNGSRTGALVLIDGVRQNRLTGDEVHWASIPVDQIERIEVIRGGGSLMFGEGALSGLIAITTKKGAGQPLQLEQLGELGSYGQRRAGISARGRGGPVAYGASYNRRDVSGYRESTGSRATAITGHAGVDPWPAVHAEVNVLQSNDVTGFAGGITPAASETRRRQQGGFAGFFEEEIAQVALDTVLRGPAGIVSTIGTYWRERESDAVVGGSRFATITPSKGLQLRTSQHAEMGEVDHTLITGLELADEKASTGARGFGFSESNKSSYGLYAEETVRLFDRASLVAGLRYDRARFEESLQFPSFTGTLRFEGWSPRIALSADVWGPVTVYGSYARPFKAPQVDDFAAVVPTGFFGNIDLQPQQADDYALGVRASVARVGQLEACWFFMRIDDEILFNDLVDQSQNFDTRRAGLELSATPAVPVPGLVGRIAYSFTDAEFRKGQFADGTVPGAPEHRVTASVSYELLRGVFLMADWLLVHDFFRINDFTNAAPGDNYGVLDLGLRVDYHAARFFAKIENATNEEYTTYQSSDGFSAATGENPSPPIALRAGVSVAF